MFEDYFKSTALQNFSRKNRFIRLIRLLWDKLRPSLYYVKSIAIIVFATTKCLIKNED